MRYGLILELAGDVHFDDAERYTVDSPTGRNLLWVAVHELGHSIGLDHSTVKGAVMFPWYQSTQGKDFDLTPDDIKGAQSIYGTWYCCYCYLLVKLLIITDW